jgi:hypothetical protein
MSAGIEHDVFLVPAQYPTIQHAIDAVSRASTIMVSPGVYAEDLRIVGKQSVVIESVRLGRRGVTVVGSAAESVVSIESSAVYLNGIEIRSDSRGRGMSSVDSSIALQECVVAGNQVAENCADPSGAGMLGLRSSIRIQKSLVAGNVVHGGGRNAGGGGLYLVDCKVEIAGSSIQANAVYASGSARGGGMWCERVRLRMWRSRVTDNALYGSDCEGAGIYFRESIGAQLGGSVITGNGRAQGRGGGIFISGNARSVAIHRNTVVRQNHPQDLYAE